MPMSRARVWNVSCWRIATKAKSRNASVAMTQAARLADLAVEMTPGQRDQLPTSPGGCVASSETRKGTVGGSVDGLGAARNGTAPDYRPLLSGGARITTLSRMYPLGGGTYWTSRNTTIT